MTTTHQILRRRLSHLEDDDDDLTTLAEAPCALSEVLTDFSPSATAAAWLMWVGTRDASAVVGFTELLRQHNHARDRVLHQALDRLHVAKIDDRTGADLSVLGRLIELIAARGAA